MPEFILHALRADPEIAVFLAIALGVFVGRIRIGSFHLGSVAGALLMGLLIGQIGLEVPTGLKSVFFVMFIYAVGFKSGRADHHFRRRQLAQRVSTTPVARRFIPDGLQGSPGTFWVRFIS